MKLGKDEKELTVSAVSSYVRFLDTKDLPDKNYVDEVRSLHLKILRNSDWSYIFWNMPHKSFSGKIKVILSSFPDIKRKSSWKLYSNGKLTLASFIFSKQISLADKAKKIRQISNERFTISFKDFEEIDIVADSRAAETISLLATLIESDTFLSRTIPAMIIIDAVAHMLCSSHILRSEKQKLMQILEGVSSAFYGITPKLITQTQELQPSPNSIQEKIKIEIGEEALHMLCSILNEYCELKESSAQTDHKEKLSAAKKLREIFRKAQNS